jgi:hypothetical protein
VRLQCVRQEDRQTVLDRTRPAVLHTAATEVLADELKLPGDGLYVLTVTADDGAGTVLRMEKGLEVGKTRLMFAATPPAGERRGKRDAAEVLGPGLPDRQFTTLDPDFVTPHLPLLRPHVNGPVRAMFLTPADSTLGHVREIAQRGDFAVEYYAAGKVALPKGELNPRSLNELAKKFRAGNCQVLVTLGIDWNAGLKTKLGQEILARVREGMGLVAMADDLQRHPVLAAALADAKPLPADVPLPHAATAVPSMRRWELGKGRVAIIDCALTPARDQGRYALGNWTELRIGKSSAPVPEIKWRGFEYAYARLADLVRWAAGRDAPITITGAALESDRVSVEVHNAGQAATAQLEVVARSRRWEARAAGKGSVQIPPGTSRHSAVLDVAPDGGPLALEIHIRDGAQKVLAFASVGVRAESPVEIKVVPSSGSQAADGPVRFAVELQGKSLQGRLRVQLLDRFGRLVFQRDQEVNEASGKKTVEFTAEGLMPLSVYHEVVAQWLGDRPRGRVLAEASAEVFLVPSRPYFADRFAAGPWGAPERDALLIQAGLNTARQLGMFLHTHSYNDSLLYLTGGYKAGAANLSIHSRYARPGEKPKLDSERLIMEPPLVPNDEALQAAKTAWQTIARKEFNSGARMLGLDDERRISDDFDFHPQTLAAFRRWLAGRYRTIADLNRTWGAAFADFGQVVPKRRKELGDSPNLAPWLDFRMFIGDALGEFYMKQPAQWAAEISPELSVAEWGIYEPSTAWPVDWSKYAACYRFTSRYGDKQGVLEELFRCFAPATRHGTWQGYGMLQATPDRRIAPWQSLLNGGSFCLFWELRDPGSLNYAVLTSDQRPTAGYATLAKDDFPDLTGGIDRIVLASRFLDDRIAIAYSYPSWLAGSEALARAAKVVIEELGYQHRFVNLEDLPGGVLTKEKFKLLVVQAASCISREQRQALAAFVEAGGTLLCLGRSGWRDLHGAPHADGSSLDELTGVNTDRAAPLGRVMRAGDPASARWLTVANKGIAVKDARVLAACDLDGTPLPVLTLRTRGQGRVYWLNSMLDGHQAIHRGGAAEERSIALGGPLAVRQSHWKLLDEIVQAAGIRPRCRLLAGDRPLFDTETWYYATPSGRSLLVAHYLSEDRRDPATVRLDRKGWVYEMRTGRCLGHTDAFQDSFPAGVMRVYLITDYKVKGLALAAAPPEGKPGGCVRVACTVETDGLSPDLHAVRLEVCGPDGNDLPAYRMVLSASEGKAVATLPMALDQTPGKYRVRAVDAVSGIRAEAEFRVVKE